MPRALRHRRELALARGHSVGGTLEFSAGTALRTPAFWLLATFHSLRDDRRHGCVPGCPGLAVLGYSDGARWPLAVFAIP
jgi:hypothetical protein